MYCAERYAEKYFSVLGDSISTLAGYHPLDCAVFYEWEQKRAAGIYCPEDTWWGRVIDALGGKLLVNDSFSGSMVTKHPACQIESYGCSDTRTGRLGIGAQDPDVIMVLLGLNDFGAGAPLHASAVEKDLSVFSVAYGTMLAKLRRNYPMAEIWCLTLPQSCWRSQPDFEVPLCRSGGHLTAYCDVIRNCAVRNSCRVVDIARSGMLYDTIDGYHPNVDGMQAIADAVLHALEKEGSV